MNEPIKEKFSFLNFLDENINLLASERLEIEDSLKDQEIFRCIENLFKVADVNDWLKLDQSCNAKVRDQFEEIFKEHFNKNNQIK